MGFSILNVVPNTGSIVLVPTHPPLKVFKRFLKDFYLDDHETNHMLPLRAYQGLGSISGPNTSLSQMDWAGGDYGSSIPVKEIFSALQSRHTFHR